jgi:hypothetical protein
MDLAARPQATTSGRRYLAGSLVVAALYGSLSTSRARQAMHLILSVDTPVADA